MNNQTETHAPTTACSSATARNGEMTVDEAAKAALDELQKETLPLRVVSWRVETGLDTVDEPAVWVRATLDPGAVCARELIDKWEALEDRIVDKVWERVREYDNRIWIYTYFTDLESDATQ